jgi:KDO2-lipid IV(A) lauroyltransferase
VTTRHRIELAAFRFFRAAVGWMPEGWVGAFGAAVGSLAGGVLRIRRSDVDAHLRLAFPDETTSSRARTARGSYAHLGREAATLLRLRSWTAADFDERVTLNGLEELEGALAEGRGVVLLGGHLGNWEVAGAALAARGIPIDVVAKGAANRGFEEEMFAHREKLGLRVIEMSSAPRQVLRALRGGRVVAILGDQNAHKNGVFIPFFGNLAATPKGPAVFALRSGAPVFFGTAVRRDGPSPRYEVHLRRLPTGATASDGAAGDSVDGVGSGARGVAGPPLTASPPDNEVDGLLTRYHVALERAIRATPAQYFWQHRRWKTRPPEELAREG